LTNALWALLLLQAVLVVFRRRAIEREVRSTWSERSATSTCAEGRVGRWIRST